MFFVYYWFGSAIFVGFPVVGANNDRYSSAKLPGWPCTKAGLDQKKCADMLYGGGRLIGNCHHHSLATVIHCRMLFATQLWPIYFCWGSKCHFRLTFIRTCGRVAWGGVRWGAVGCGGVPWAGIACLDVDFPLVFTRPSHLELMA